MEFKFFILVNFCILEDSIYYVDIFCLEFDKLKKESEGIKKVNFLFRD